MKTCRASAMDFLAVREHSRVELVRKLKTKGFSELDIEQTLDQLLADNLQSDVRFAQAFVRSRLQRGYGPKRVAVELEQRGIAADWVATHVWGQPDIWLEALNEVYTKKYGDTPASEMKEKAKRMRFLLQRGFEPEQIREVLQ